MRKPKAQKEVPEVITPIPEGLTKREYLAAMFLQGMLGTVSSNWYCSEEIETAWGNKKKVRTGSANPQKVFQICRNAYAFADAFREVSTEPRDIDFLTSEETAEMMRDDGFTEKEIKEELRILSRSRG